jgi:hypothetical protein
MNKKLLLSITLATLIVPNIFSMDDSEWKPSKQDQNEIIQMFADLQKNPSTLSFLNWYKLSDAQFNGIIKRLKLNQKSPEITCIIISIGEITDNTLELIAKYYPKLTILHLSVCNQITATGIRTVAEKCLGLTTLSIPSHITDDNIQVFAAKCSKLTVLDIGSNFSLTDKGIKQLPKLFPSLKELQYNLSPDDDRCTTLNELDGIKTINGYQDW